MMEQTMFSDVTVDFKYVFRFLDYSGFTCTQPFHKLFSVSQKEDDEFFEDLCKEDFRQLLNIRI